MKNNVLSKNLEKNINTMDGLFEDCDDIKSRKMTLGNKADVSACIYYVEVAVNNMTLEESVIGKLLGRLMGMSPDGIYEYLDANALGITDVNMLATVDEAVMGVMIGDGVLLIDGYDKAIKIKSKGYPMMGLTESKTEKVTRGSREGFADALKSNTALIRKRLRNNALKVKEKIIGYTSNTTVAIVYDSELVRKSVLDEVNKRISALNTDGITDTGIIEQLTEENIHSPFPQYQTTERPDKAAMEILNGRVILFVDNSPVALILPVNYGSFFQTADDYYNRYMVASMARIIRYLAAFIAVTLPAAYLAVTGFHPEILPTKLLISIAASRYSVPFPAIAEVIIMEMAFELLREAGVRVPGSLGGTIGIVGGLIVGQAAVSAGIVSPIIVVIVALTALSSFAIPNEEMAAAYRVLKYVMILFAWILGGLGIIICWICITAHLSRLKSFNFPYLAPVSGAELNDMQDERDMLVRAPLASLRKKSFFVRPGKRDGRGKI